MMDTRTDKADMYSRDEIERVWGLSYKAGYYRGYVDGLKKGLDALIEVNNKNLPEYLISKQLLRGDDGDTD